MIRRYRAWRLRREHRHCMGACSTCGRLWQCETCARWLTVDEAVVISQTFADPLGLPGAGVTMSATYCKDHAPKMEGAHREQS